MWDDLTDGIERMPGPRSPRVVQLSLETRAELVRLTRRPSVAAGLARRARIVLLAADGVPLSRIAQESRSDRKTVRTWVDRFRTGGGRLARSPAARATALVHAGGGVVPGAAGL